MSEATTRAGVYAVLSSVTNIGMVYDYRRFKADWSAFLALFKTTISAQEQVRGWQISLKGARENESSVKTYLYRIEGFLGVSDSTETEKTFVALIDAIALAFRSDKTLSAAALGHDFVQASVVEERVFGSVLCHFCELNVTVYDHNP